MKHRLMVVSVLAALGLGSAGCADAYSQRRIQSRWSSMRRLAEDLAEREAGGLKRNREAVQTLKKWWQRDVEDFQQRVPTIGDYVW